jgi:hypothetical protein
VPDRYSTRASRLETSRVDHRFWVSGLIPANPAVIHFLDLATVYVNFRLMRSQRQARVTDAKFGVAAAA